MKATAAGSRKQAVDITKDGLVWDQSSRSCQKLAIENNPSELPDRLIRKQLLSHAAVVVACFRPAGALPKLRFISLNTSRTNARIFRSGWLAGTRASGEMYENNPP